VDYFRASRVRAGLPSCDDVSPERLRAALATGDLEISSGRFPRGLAAADGTRPAYVLICVPTPLRRGQDPDTSAIESAVQAVSSMLTLDEGTDEGSLDGLVVVLVSTTYPGTTQDLVASRLQCQFYRLRDPEDRGPEWEPLGERLFVANAPERVDPGRDGDHRLVPRVVGGDTPACTDVAATLFGTICDRVHRVSSTRAAEMSKLLENTYRAVNIGLANEFAKMCHAFRIPTQEVVDAAATKPYGFQRFDPGPGVGGHCIPLDPRYLEHAAQQLGYFSPLIAAAERVNASMPGYVAGRAAGMLNRAGKPVNGSRVHVLGVAYKANISDARESPIAELISWFRQHGARVTYHDPLVPAFHLDRDTEIRSTPSAVEPCDLLVLATLHDCMGWQEAVHAAPLTFDARGALPPSLVRASGNLEQL